MKLKYRALTVAHQAAQAAVEQQLEAARADISFLRGTLDKVGRCRPLHCQHPMRTRACVPPWHEQRAALSLPFVCVYCVSLPFIKRLPLNHLSHSSTIQQDRDGTRRNMTACIHSPASGPGC